MYMMANAPDLGILLPSGFLTTNMVTMTLVTNNPDCSALIVVSYFGGRWVFSSSKSLMTDVPYTPIANLPGHRYHQSPVSLITRFSNHQCL